MIDLSLFFCVTYDTIEYLITPSFYWEEEKSKKSKKNKIKQTTVSDPS